MSRQLLKLYQPQLQSHTAAMTAWQPYQGPMSAVRQTAVPAYEAATEDCWSLSSRYSRMTWICPAGFLPDLALTPGQHCSAAHLCCRPHPDARPLSPDLHPVEAP
jgi:hypothetical protein